MDNWNPSSDNGNPLSDNGNPSSESFTSPVPSQSPTTSPNEVNGECGNNWIVIIFLIISFIINVILILTGVVIYISRSQASKRKDGENKIVETESEEGKEMIEKKTQETEFDDNRE
ncbi:hypothetical protein BSL78_29163 [Apostichopus japonicus]|uniref:Uncharacterized protein n=1 Tax=Stichopus japonicus TaxID=307972 RepID=A0A2G8JE82_STIJA|nr:hypothetical protein BSL78_29163 [Apostichopus japonicus]